MTYRKPLNRKETAVSSIASHFVAGTWEEGDSTLDVTHSATERSTNWHLISPTSTTSLLLQPSTARSSLGRKVMCIWVASTR